MLLVNKTAFLSSPNLHQNRSVFWTKHPHHLCDWQKSWTRKQIDVDEQFRCLSRDTGIPTLGCRIQRWMHNHCTLLAKAACLSVCLSVRLSVCLSVSQRTRDERWKTSALLSRRQHSFLCCGRNWRVISRFRQRQFTLEWLSTELRLGRGFSVATAGDQFAGRSAVSVAMPPGAALRGSYFESNA